MQPADFYLGNPVFWLKMTAFAVVAVLSIVPTTRYPRWRRLPVDATLRPEEVTRVRRFITAELLVFSVIPICAALMARGIGN